MQILVVDDLRLFGSVFKNFEINYAVNSAEALAQLDERAEQFVEIWLDHDLGEHDTVLPRNQLDRRRLPFVSSPREALVHPDFDQQSGRLPKDSGLKALHRNSPDTATHWDPKINSVVPARINLFEKLAMLYLCSKSAVA